ncbi:MAG: VTT domain-containing protein, partial [Patescibacteria group bacterium]
YHLLKAERFYEKRGKITVLVGRLIPIVRTFAPIVAGIGRMHYPTFLLYNVAGGVAWGAGLTLLGFYFGKVIPDPGRYILPIVAILIIASLFPVFSQMWKAAKGK